MDNYKLLLIKQTTEETQMKSKL